MSDIYRLSYLYYALLSFLIVIVVGIVVSLLTGPVDSSQLNENLFVHCSFMKKKKSKKVIFNSQYTSLTRCIYLNLKIEINLTRI